jgi:hypothetical protein
MAIKFQNIQQPKPVDLDPEAIVEIVLKVPLRCFGEGQALSPSGDILEGHWVNIDRFAFVQTEVRGLRADVDVVAGFNPTTAKVTLRHITKRKPKSERADKPASTYVPAKRAFL